MPKTIYHFCPRCGHQLAWRHEYADHANEPKRQVCAGCGYVLYINSSPTASALIINKKDEVLLAKRAWPPAKGKWDTLGGFLENGEDPIKGLRREIKEETGVTLKNIKYLGIYLDDYHHNNRIFKTLNIFYTAEIARGKPKPSDDIAGVKWFARNRLPKNLAFRNCRQALADWKKSL
ncbi:MAG: NUDIX hydrolase [Patescibacteria group bacterium]